MSPVGKDTHGLQLKVALQRRGPGTVPADLALQSSLQKLNLSHNAFSGAPASLPLAAFGECYAANNMFSHMLTRRQSR